VWAGKMRRCRRKRGRHECSPSGTRGGDRRGSWSMDPEERTPRANVNVSPDVRSPIFFFPSHEHRSHAEAMPVTYIRMPVARPALSERPYQTVNSSAKGFYRACVVSFSFVIIISRGISRSTLILRWWSHQDGSADNKYGRSSNESMYLSVNRKDFSHVQ